MRLTKQIVLLAKMNGVLDRVRGDEIDARLKQRGYPRSAQIALLFDKDTKPEEVEAYQKIRAEVKAEVDAEIAALE